MKKSIASALTYLGFAILLAVTLGATASANAPQAGESRQDRFDPAPQRILVQFTETAFREMNHGAATLGRSGIASLDTRLSSLQPTVMRPLFGLNQNLQAHRAAGLDRIYAIEYEAEIAPRVAAALASGEGLVYAEADEPRWISSTTPDDSSYPDQWAHHNPGVFPLNWSEDCDADNDIMWDFTTGDPSLIIAILDTGVELTHPEFAGRVLPGWDFVNGDPDATDDDAHGTACAGIALAEGNNGIGVAGCVWNSLLLPVKVMNFSGGGNTSTSAQGIIWATDQGADIISMSYGGGSFTSTENNAVNYAWGQNVLLFGATGNDNAPTISYPAKLTNCIAVGSVSPCDERKNPSSCDGEGWWGSNYGTGIDFLAPGVLMYTTDRLGSSGYDLGDYTPDFNGTSSATPHAAGVGALVRSYFPAKTNTEIRDLLRAGCDDLGAPGYDTETGYGRVNSYSSVLAGFFTDATHGPLGDTSNGRGVSWGDYDGDGDPDIYMTNASGQSNKLFENNSGIFSDATSGALGSTASSHGAVWGDYDNDGDQDLYLCNDGANQLIRNDAGTFNDVTVSPMDHPDDGRMPVWVDYDHDGDLDLYFCNYGTNNKVMDNDSGVFTDVTFNPLIDLNRSGNTTVWGDYDGDGDLDLFIGNEGQISRIVMSNGDGTFVSGNSITAEVWSAAWGDYDNDEDQDLFIGIANGPNMLLQNNDGVFSDVAYGRLADTDAAKGAAWGDFDNDGWLDLFIANDGVMNTLLRNEEGQWFSDVSVTGPLADNGAAHSAAWADYDGDGDLDLYVVNASGANVLIRNDLPADNHWLQIRLTGTSSNLSGVGTHVRIVAGGMSQVRDVVSSSGHLSQNELVAAFGLGSATMIDSIEVLWPSGTLDIATDVSADQKLTFVEGAGTVAVELEELGSTISTLKQNTPNPFTRTTSIRYQIATNGPVSLKIYGVDGRTIRSLVDGEQLSGSYRVDWDRKDDGGVPVSSGVYYYKLVAGERQEARQMVVLD